LKERQRGSKEQAHAAAPSEPPKIIELKPDIFQFRSEKPGSHIYLIKGDSRNVLIDTGTTHNFPAVVAAHCLAANKLELQDEFVTLNRYYNVPSKPFWVDIWLEDGAIIDLGTYKLKVLHTPGHTSGCACFYEPNERLLFSGDTIFAGGTLSDIAGSGSVSDYMNSVQHLNNLTIKEIYPGHGRLSNTPDEDLPKAVQYAQALLDDSKAFFEAFIKTRNLQAKSGIWQQKSES